MPPIIDLEKCNSCGVCDKYCPLDVIHMNENEEENVSVVVYPYECKHCGVCRMNCPLGAIAIEFPLSMLV